jgi:non-ribosomal peptide synthetase component E (peptide arylation enzyme)
MDSILGEKIHVVIYSDNHNNNLEKLQKLCLKNLSEYKQPDYWTCLNSELPKNKNGKILKTLLIDEMKDKF